jgi:hypothetical protein
LFLLGSKNDLHALSDAMSDEKCDAVATVEQSPGVHLENYRKFISIEHNGG